MYGKLLSACLAFLLCFGVRPWQKTSDAQEQASVGTSAQTVQTHVSAEKTARSQPTGQVFLTAEEAEGIALAHAELSAADVVFSRTEYDIENRVPVWEVEFRFGDQEYDCVIHAQSGEVLTFDSDVEPKAPTEQKRKAESEKPKTDKPQTTTVPSAPKQTAETPAQGLTEDQAIAAALAHAGLKKDDISGLRAKRDRDDGIPVYEIEFRHGWVEYEYEIHAGNGTILEWDKEIDD